MNRVLQRCCTASLFVLMVWANLAFGQLPPRYQVAAQPPYDPALQPPYQVAPGALPLPPPTSAPYPQQPPPYENVPLPAPNNPLGNPPNSSVNQGLVLGVEVVGNQFVDASRVHQELRTRQDREFDETVVHGDVRRLLRTGLFYNVKTFTTPGPGGVYVRFQVFERPIVRGIRFVGNWHYMDRTLKKQVNLEPGKPLTSYAVDDGRRRLEEYYQSKGFPKATVSVLEGDKPGDAYVIYVINEGNLERIKHVEFVGNSEVVSNKRLKTFIESKPGIMWYFMRGKVEREKIDKDVERITAYYRSLGFFRARVGRELTYDHDHKWLTLTFVINEGPRYTIRNVNIAGNGKFTADSLLAQLDLKAGDFFNLPKMNRDVQTLTDIYGEHGHVYVDVQADPRFLEEPGQLDLIYQIEEGEPFSLGKIHVHIDGDYPHTRKSVVLNRMAGLYPGTIFNNKKFAQSKRILGASQLFENNPAQGKEIRMEIQQPTAADIAKREAQRRRAQSAASYRGQSPAPPHYRQYPPSRDVHGNVTPLR